MFSANLGGVGRQTGEPPLLQTELWLPLLWVIYPAVCLPDLCRIFDLLTPQSCPQHFYELHESSCCSTSTHMPQHLVYYLERTALRPF